MARRIYTEEKTMKRIAILEKDEEVVVRGNNVFIKKKFDAYKWADEFLLRNWSSSVAFQSINSRVTIAFDLAYPTEKPGIAICSTTDKFSIIIGKAIALARLLEKPLPKELFE